jgi:hypothetical protein
MTPDDSAPLSFVEAEAQLHGLLASQGWPRRLSYVPSDQTQWLDPSHVAVFRPGPTSSAAAVAAFGSARAAGIPVEICAVASVGPTTFVSVRTIHALGQGEGMFISRATKIECRVPQFTAVIVHSRLYWRLLCWRVSLQQRRALKLIRRDFPPPNTNGAA